MPIIWIKGRHSRRRREYIDYQAIDCRATSKLMPEWMISKSIQPSTIRRYFGKANLMNKYEQPAKSVFNFMDVRHNVPKADMIPKDSKLVV